MPARKIAALPAVASFAAYGQALLDDATIGKLVKVGVGVETIVAIINQAAGKVHAFVRRHARAQEGRRFGQGPWLP